MSQQGGSGQEQVRMPIIANLFLLALEVLAAAVREEKDKTHPNWQRSSKTVTICK